MVWLVMQWAVASHDVLIHWMLAHLIALAIRPE